MGIGKGWNKKQPEFFQRKDIFQLENGFTDCKNRKWARRIFMKSVLQKAFDFWGKCSLNIAKCKLIWLGFILHNCSLCVNN